MCNNYEQKLLQEIITGNYEEKLSQEIMRRNYHKKFSASIYQHAKNVGIIGILAYPKKHWECYNPCISITRDRAFPPLWEF